jgi:hypothetical protein
LNTNAGRQRDLSVSYEKVGDAQQAQGDLTEAKSCFHCAQSGCSSTSFATMTRPAVNASQAFAG